jgi:hypothetical protein
MRPSQIFAVTTSQFGPGGPLKRLYAVNARTPETAFELLEPRLKAGEIAKWVDARSFSLEENEVRRL